MNRLIVCVVLFVFGFLLAETSYGQGRPAGAGGGRPAGAGPPPNAGPPAGIGVDRGLGTARDRSGGRSDDGLSRASDRSGGRSDDGLNRARMGGNNGVVPDDRELRRYTGISQRLGVAPETLRTQFEAALAANPNLNFGLFVAANVLADNLNSRHPAITTPAILAGLQSGNNLGRTLQDLGLGENQADDAEDFARREIKESRKNAGKAKKP